MLFTAFSFAQASKASGDMLSAATYLSACSRDSLAGGNKLRRRRLSRAATRTLQSRAINARPLIVTLFDMGVRVDELLGDIAYTLLE